MLFTFRAETTACLQFRGRKYYILKHHWLKKRKKYSTYVYYIFKYIWKSCVILFLIILTLKNGAIRSRKWRFKPIVTDQPKKRWGIKTYLFKHFLCFHEFIAPDMLVYSFRLNSNLVLFFILCLTRSFGRWISIRR